MYEELVKRLREKAARFDYDGWVDTAAILEEAADAIEELVRAAEVNAKRALKWAFDAEKAEEKFRWISVEERLPEDTYPVLVTYLGYNDKLPKSDMVAMYDDGDWYWYDEESKCKVAITHWMPLPEPPQDE